MSRCLIAFSLGPVQTFIESARSVRDLWTGSYLLSWLTYHAMRPILLKNEQRADSFIFPDISNHPLWTSDPGCCSKPVQVVAADLDQFLSPCLPNRFLAIVPFDENDARDLAAKCVEACHREWKDICEDTYNQIAAKIPGGSDQFKRDLWDAQSESFFEIQTVILPLAQYDAAIVNKWLGNISFQQPPETAAWLQSWALLQSLFAASRTVRHVPKYSPIDQNHVTAKCSILGSYEQMGPAGLKESKDFWKSFCRSLDQPGVVVNGIGMRSGERFCAISMVKRFAFATALSKRLRARAADTVDISNVVRYPDTHTVAAAKWLTRSEHVQDDFELQRKSHWNGQWLHWERPNQDGVDVCSDRTWQEIQEKKGLRGKGAVPIYYAVLMLDGDKMGDRLRVASQSEQTNMSRLMSQFALKEARTVVEDHFGTLIYSGGDDVLALLPIETALDCADNLRQKFSELWLKEGYQDVTASAGVSLVHAKEDLRLALGYARAAEKLAKKSGRNCLALKTCRGSGEYSTAVLPWDVISVMNRWVASFINQASDRWAYRLAAEMTTWSAFSDIEILKKELNRQLARSDDETRCQFLPQTDSATMMRDLQDYYDLSIAWSAQKTQAAEPSVGKLFEQFITLIQSASFIARGRDH
ncbi:MAG: type III-B CRISPR-associated protein Cas10/Cmr2 [Planctomycetota bacterium]